MRGSCVWCQGPCEWNDPYCSTACEIAHENHQEREELEESERLEWLGTLAPSTKVLVETIKGRSNPDPRFSKPLRAGPCRSHGYVGNGICWACKSLDEANREALTQT